MSISVSIVLLVGKFKGGRGHNATGPGESRPLIGSGQQLELQALSPSSSSSSLEGQRQREQEEGKEEKYKGGEDQKSELQNHLTGMRY